MSIVVYILRERGQNYPFFTCVLGEQKELEQTEKRKREQKELERSGENLCIKL